MKHLITTLSTLLLLLTLQACTTKTEIKYVDKPIEVYVPVKCIVPKAECNFNRETDTEVISAMLECITDMTKNEERCND